jgi:hypothetical protein
MRLSLFVSSDDAHRRWLKQMPLAVRYLSCRLSRLHSKTEN